MTDNEFIAKTINECNTDLTQYPAAKVQQMAKKLESSKDTAKHASNSTHPICMLHCPNQCLDDTIALAYHPRRKKAVKNQTPVKELSHSNPQQQKQTNQHQPYDRKVQISVLDVVIPHMHKDLTAQLRNTSANIATKIRHFTKDVLYQKCTPTATALS